MKEKDKYYNNLTLMQNLEYDTNDPIYEHLPPQRTGLRLPRRGQGRGGSGWIINFQPQELLHSWSCHGQSYTDLSFVNYSGQTFLNFTKSLGTLPKKKIKDKFPKQSIPTQISNGSSKFLLFLLIINFWHLLYVVHRLTVCIANSEYIYMYFFL